MESLLDLPRPVDLPLRESNPTMQEHRARPVETTVYTVEVDVTDCRLMPDGDYRVTLRGASGKTIVMEMPDTAPDFIDPTALFVKQMREARISFADKFTPEKTAKSVVGHARITGIGYFGRAYGDKPVERQSNSTAPGSQSGMARETHSGVHAAQSRQQRRQIQSARHKTIGLNRRQARETVAR